MGHTLLKILIFCKPGIQKMNIMICYMFTPPMLKFILTTPRNMSELSGTLHLLCAIDTVPETMNQKQLPDDQQFTGGLTSSLELKIGARVMLTRKFGCVG